MRTAIIVSALVLQVVPTQKRIMEPAPANTEITHFPEVSHQAFKKGERLKYLVSYGWMDAGEAVIEIKNETKTMAGRDVMHMVGTGRSLGAFDFFFEVRDRYESYVDATSVIPWMFVRDISEGGFKLKQQYAFDQYKQKVKTNKGQEYNVPVGIQDMISAFYRARTMDFSRAKPGQTFEMKAFVDGEVWPMKIRYIRNERIEIDKGTFNCMVFRPVVQTGRIFDHEEDMTVWVTNDKNKIPVLAKAKILVGSITMELSEYQGLANPIAKVPD